MKHRNDYTSVFPAAVDVQSRETDNFVLLFGDSSQQTWKAIGFTVNQVQRRIERVNNLPSLDDGDTLDLGFMGDNGHSEDANVTDPGDDRLDIGGDFEETVEEWGLAVQGDDILVGLENPQGAPVTGLQDDDLRGFDSDVFDEEGAVRSQHTRTEDGLPTTALSSTPRQGVFRIDSEENGRNHTYVGFQNVSGNDNVTPNVLAYGATYRVTNQPESVVRSMLDQRNSVKARIATWGGFENDNPNLPDEWEPNVVEITNSSVNGILGMGRA